MKYRLSSVWKISNLLRDWTVGAYARWRRGPEALIRARKNFQSEKINGRIYGWITGFAFNFHHFFKSTSYIYLGSFMQIGRILKKFIRPHIRPDIRIVTKIKKDIFCHRNINSWEFHAANYYRFWVIVWTNIREKNIRISGRISGRMIESD